MYGNYYDSPHFSPFDFFGSIFIFTIMLNLALGVIPAYIAGKKGHSWFVWYIYSVFLFPIAFFQSLFLEQTEEVKNFIMKNNGYYECPFCKEFIKIHASVCPHCQRDLLSIKNDNE
jgi:hypothetical protein